MGFCRNMRCMQLEAGHAGMRALEMSERGMRDRVVWRARQGVALTLGALSPSVKAAQQLPVIFAFLKRALADEHEAVAAEMVGAGRELIERQPDAASMVSMLVPMLESFLAEPATTAAHDRVRQGVVLYMGSLAKHIPADDPKVAQVVSRLMDALGTPSETAGKATTDSANKVFFPNATAFIRCLRSARSFAAFCCAF